METEIVSINRTDTPESIDRKLSRAGEIIKQGGLVAFPTETVYGLGGDALNPQSSRKIYAAKGRPGDNPLIVHIADMEHLGRIVSRIPEKAEKLAEAFWPGPLTMIFEKSKLVPYETTGGLDTVAVRMPSHRLARLFIEKAGGYIAAPSANLSGKPSPTTAKYVIQDMDGRIDMIIDAQGVEIGLESTIVDMTGDIPMILRPGYITQEMLSRAVGETDMDVTIFDSSSAQAPKAPGMKYRHYAPKGELVIVEGEPQKVVRYINEQTAFYRAQGKRTGIIGTDELIADYCADSIKNAGSRNDSRAVARQLYTFLREFDDEGIDYMYAQSFAESFEDRGFGQAVMNRLLKAAGHKVVKV
ncbi:MAG: threonylcarbamoyl-AMP synthase [Lachnospiraceae bacterium]|nr:threonylcarbamoyl-AMP synthase [Lachnospiraceae bacterium]